MKRYMRKSCWPILMAVAILSSCLLGCSNDKPKGSVFGTVTFGGKPVVNGTVLFSNPAVGTGTTAKLDASGKYKIDSILTGAYQVAITPPPAPAPHEMRQSIVLRVHVPPKYQSVETSDLTATVEPEANQVDFNL